MLRWKLFIPLVVVLTAAGLLGSYFWSASASARNLSALNSQGIADITLQGKAVTIQLKSGQALTDILKELDSEDIKEIAKEKEIKFLRTGMQPVESDLVNQVELIMAQAVAKEEYYVANKQLRELAAEWGYRAETLIWQGMLVVEVGDSEHSYIAQSLLQEVMVP